MIPRRAPQLKATLKQNTVYLKGELAMADISAGEFRPFRALSIEARIRRIEDWLVSASVTGERDAGLASEAGTVVIGGASIPLPLPEEDIDFDSGDGHNHNGEESNFIEGTGFEVSFGSIPTRYATITITDSLVVPGLHIFVYQKADAPTGKSQDENEMDPIIARAVAETGQFTAYLTALEGPVVGSFKFGYHIARSDVTGA